MHVKPLLSRDHGVTLAQLAVALDIAADHIHHAVNPPYGVGIPSDITRLNAMSVLEIPRTITPPRCLQIQAPVFHAPKGVIRKAVGTHAP